MHPSVLNVPEFDPPSRVRGCGRAAHVPEGARIPQGVRHGDLAGLVSTIRSISGESHFPVESNKNSRRSSAIYPIATPFEWRVATPSESPEPRWCSNGTRRSRPVGDIVPEPPRRPAQLRRGCWVPASRAVRSNGCQREIRRAHARPRAPARAGGAPSRPRHALARRERRCSARTDARQQPSPSQQLAPSEHRSRRIRRDPRDPRVGPRGAAAPHATPAESAGATERLLRPPGRVIIGPLDGAAEHGPRRPMDQDDDPRREAALRDARRAAAGRPSRQSLAIVASERPSLLLSAGCTGVERTTAFRLPE